MYDILYMKFISLGCWCGITTSLKGNSLYYAALPFDHIRSTFIGIIDCFENNFDNFFPKKVELDIIENYTYSGRSFRGKYFGFYHHNLFDDVIVSHFTRRINRLKDIMANTQENIVFIRTILTHDCNDELDLGGKFLDTIKLKYPSLNFILIFIIPGQSNTQYYKNINEKIFIFTLNDISTNDYDIKEEYKPIYDYILNNDLFNKIPTENDIEINNGYNKLAQIDGIPITKDDN